MWEGNKSQAGSLESIILDGAKKILGCSSKTCNKAVTGDVDVVISSFDIDCSNTDFTTTAMEYRIAGFFHGPIFSRIANRSEFCKKYFRD